MTEEQGTPAAGRRAWSVETFERFWSNPDPAVVPGALTDDVVGYWSGREEPVRGKRAYTACIAALVEGLPGMHIAVAEHASNGEFTFIRWIMHATGVHGRFEFSGIDRVRTRDDGLVVENRIVCDTSAFKRWPARSFPGSRCATWADLCRRGVGRFGAGLSQVVNRLYPGPPSQRKAGARPPRTAVFAGVVSGSHAGGAGRVSRKSVRARQKASGRSMLG